MIEPAIILIAYAAQSAAAFWLFVRDMRSHSRMLGIYMTNGDAVFCAIMSLIPLSLIAALIITGVHRLAEMEDGWIGRRSRLDR